MLKKINFTVLSTVSFFYSLFTFADSPALPAGTSAPVAQAITGGAAPAQQGMTFGMFLPIIVMFVVFYFFMVRPQQKKLKEHQDLLGGLKTGDEIISASGILGKITGLTEKVVTVEIANDVKVKMLKSQISQVVKGNI
ncbi:MAG: preprotein translocase subunit YajC [Xanthomonadaceae bacterium]|nr:preprotein translocase subunit YajC [Xanthomonadaceae bacterium]